MRYPTHPPVITRKFKFEASHVLPLHPGKCSRLHGHSWELTVGISAESQDKVTGFVLDYAEFKRIVNETIIDKLDHQHLGCGALVGEANRVYWPASVLPQGFYPSSENLAKFIYDELALAFSTAVDKPITLDFVALKETDSTECYVYSGGMSVANDVLTKG